jgi:hypothetical protein
MNERQVAQKIIQHMHTDHGVEVISADVMHKIKHSINTMNILNTVHPVTADEMLLAR